MTDLAHISLALGAALVAAGIYIPGPTGWKAIVVGIALWAAALFVLHSPYLS